MKLVRFGAKGSEKPGVIDERGGVRDLSSLLQDWTGETMSSGVLDEIRASDFHSLPVVAAGTRLGPPLARPGKMIAIGLNYRDHAAEAGLEVPTEPIMLLKATSAIIGPNDDIEIPPGCNTTDWEVELGVVIGKTGRRIARADALDHVAGYVVANDVSERHFQLERGGQWTKGKSSDTFAPLGPWLVTKDDVDNPQALSLRLWLNDELMQDGNSSKMVFGVVDLIHRISHYTTLEAGDVMITGTPPGVGSGKKPPRYLVEGDRLRLAIDGLGEQHCRVVQAVG